MKFPCTRYIYQLSVYKFCGHVLNMYVHECCHLRQEALEVDLGHSFFGGSERCACQVVEENGLEVDLEQA